VFVNDFGPHGEPEAGRFYRCEITEAHDYDLVALLL
jgi:ribosomal protein S12 methylthiotransferase